MSGGSEAKLKATLKLAPSFMPAHVGLLQRKCACGGSSDITGECEGCDKQKLSLQRSPRNSKVETVEMARIPAEPGFEMSGWSHNFGRIAVNSVVPVTTQAKLAISQPGDPYEQEADQVADAVMRMPDLGVSEPLAPGLVESKNTERGCSSCEEKLQRQPLDETDSRVVDTKKLFPPGALQQDEEEEAKAAQQMIMTKRDGSSRSLSTPPDLVTQLARSGISGAPLPGETRQFMEPRFGSSFEDVKVHTDARSAAMCASLGAKAFTHNRDIYFGTGWYTPATNEGKHLLAHELTHVQQQAGNAPMVSRLGHPTIQRASRLSGLRGAR